MHSKCCNNWLIWLTNSGAAETSAQISSVSNGSQWLASGLGFNRQTGLVRFQTHPKPDPQLLGGPNTDPYPSTLGFCRVWLDPLVPKSASGVQVFHLWLHSDILLLIAKSWRWYVIVLFGCIGCLYNQNQERYAPCPILKMRVNGTSTMFGLASCVIWVAIGCRHS